MNDDEKRPYQLKAKLAKGGGGDVSPSVAVVSGNTIADLYTSQPMRIQRKIDVAKEERNMKSHIAHIVQTSLLNNCIFCARLLVEIK